MAGLGGIAADSAGFGSPAVDRVVSLGILRAPQHLAVSTLEVLPLTVAGHAIDRLAAIDDPRWVLRK